MKPPKPPSMEQIAASERKQAPIRQLISDNEIRALLKPKRILDTSKYALSTLSLLSKHKSLPYTIIGKAVGSATTSMSSCFVSNMVDEGLVLCDKRKAQHGTVRWITITRKGRQELTRHKIKC